MDFITRGDVQQPSWDATFSLSNVFARAPNLIFRIPHSPATDS